jgi:hypothetical protein
METPQNTTYHIELVPEGGMIRARLVELELTGLGLTPSDAKADLLAALRKYLSDYALHKSDYLRRPEFASQRECADALSEANEAGKLIVTLFGTI